MWVDGGIDSEACDMAQAVNEVWVHEEVTVRCTRPELDSAGSLELWTIEKNTLHTLEGIGIVDEGSEELVGHRSTDFVCLAIFDLVLEKVDSRLYKVSLLGPFGLPALRILNSTHALSMNDVLAAVPGCDGELCLV